METMVAPSRHQTPSLKQHLFDRCYEFDFHQAVKILEFAYPSHKPMGEGDGMGAILSFSSRIAYSYSPSDIYSLKERGGPDTPQIRMEVNFLGLAGAVGPLPMTLTDGLVDRLKQSDTGGRDFLDIFNHRLLSLVYGIRQKYWIGTGRQNPLDTMVGRCLADMAGIGLKAARGRLALNDRTLLGYGGLFWGNNRSRHGLEHLISDYFSIPVMVRDLEGGWKPLPRDNQTILTPGNENTVLGETATLGMRIWDQIRFVRLRLGPLSWGQFQSFLPGGSAFSALKDLTFFYLNRQEIRLHYVIKSFDVRPCGLGGASRLGFDSFLKTRPFLKDDDQVCLTLSPETRNDQNP